MTTAVEVAEEIAAGMGIPADVPMTDEQAEEFKAEFERRWAERKHEPLKLLPPRPLLTPEIARELLRECVTVVKPGEVLAVRLPLDMDSGDIARARGYALEVERQSGIKVAFIPGEEFAAVSAEDAA